MNEIKHIIKNDKCLKIICGAGNENKKEVKKLAYIYAKAGFNMIDLCAKQDIINAAKEGIALAGKTGEMSICVSIGLKDDIHVSKAEVYHAKCNLCKNCINSCLQNAIFIEDNKLLINEKSCIGCAKCQKICPTSAIIMEHKYKTPYEMLLPLLAEDIDCVEFHCSSSDENLIIDTLNKIKSVYKGIISICLNRSKLGDDRVINLIKKIETESSGEIIIQADGEPMTGGIDNYNSTIQCIAFAQLIRNNNIHSYLIVSGGANSKTTMLAKECGVELNGVALGSYARLIVKDCVEREDFFDNEEIQIKAVNKAIELKEELIKYF